MKGKELDISSTQDITKTVDWTKDDDAVDWIDMSISENNLKVSQIAELCSKQDGKKRTPETWRQYYYDKRELGFEIYWKEKYREFFKRSAGARLYGRLDALIDKERDLDKLVSAGEFLEGKGSVMPIQINNFVNKEKDEFGI